MEEAERQQEVDDGRSNHAVQSQCYVEPTRHLTSIYNKRRDGKQPLFTGLTRDRCSNVYDSKVTDFI